MKHLLIVMGFAWLQACAGSDACRKAAQGDLPCQNLKSDAFQNCQVEVEAARRACQSEQFKSHTDTAGYYKLPTP